MCISIETYGIAGVKAPLYHKYESQSCAQKAYIEINHKTRLVSANYYHLIGDNLPETVLDGTNVRIRVPNDVEGDALVEFMEANSEYFEAICDRVYEEFDDLNYVCRYDNEVHDAICSLEQKAAELKRVNICKASEYIAQHPLSVNWPAGKEWLEAAEDLREEFDGVIEGSLLFELLDQVYKSYKNREPITREQYAALVDIGFSLLDCSKKNWGR